MFWLRGHQTVALLLALMQKMRIGSHLALKKGKFLRSGISRPRRQGRRGLINIGHGDYRN